MMPADKPMCLSLAPSCRSEAQSPSRGGELNLRISDNGSSFFTRCDDCSSDWSILFSEQRKLARAVDLKRAAALEESALLERLNFFIEKILPLNSMQMLQVLSHSGSEDNVNPFSCIKGFSLKESLEVLGHTVNVYTCPLSRTLDYMYVHDDYANKFRFYQFVLVTHPCFDDQDLSDKLEESLRFMRFAQVYILMLRVKPDFQFQAGDITDLKRWYSDYHEHSAALRIKVLFSFAVEGLNQLIKMLDNYLIVIQSIYYHATGLKLGPSLEGRLIHTAVTDSDAQNRMIRGDFNFC